MLIKFIGGGYLIWLGIKLWCAHSSQMDISTTEIQSGRYSFLAGLSITLGNPKVILFYLGFLPTFLDLKMLSSLEIGIVAFVVPLVLGSVMMLYAFTASKARLLFKSETALDKMNKTAASVMIGTGAVLLSKT